MNYLHQRLALLAGVSLSALGLPASAFAATKPGIDRTVTSSSVDDTITICLANQSCDFGVTASGDGVVASRVDSVANGEVRQVGTATGSVGKVALRMTTVGDIEFDALADATSAGGVASAFANVGPAIVQSGAGSGDGVLNFTNDGTLAINLAASATGSSAFAAASAAGAIHQFADSFGDGDALAAFVNSGNLALGVHAAAYGESAATAVANINAGLGNFAEALGSGEAAAKIANTGDLAVAADALAAVHGTAGLANAIAFISDAVLQTASAQSGLASAGFDNSGTITIDANAVASGVSIAPLFGSAAVNATAFAVNSYAINQTGSAESGNVALDVSNSGTIDIAAGATALASIGANGTAAGTAFASALLRDGVHQRAYAPAGDVDISLKNDGIIDLSVLASATGSNADAQAELKYGVSQIATETGGYSNASLANLGNIFVGGLANAVATAGSATAHSVVRGAVRQLIGGGSAYADAENAGRIAVSAAALATGADSALAAATVQNALEQHAAGSSAAHVSLDNQGTLEVVATASAKASNDVGALAAAIATADVAAVSQHATATTRGYSSFTASGSAFLHINHTLLGPVSISLTNEGSISLSAKAVAVGDVSGSAHAALQVAKQFAGGSDVSVTIANEGIFQGAAVASAMGSQTAFAGAFATGINQFATAQASSLSGLRTAGGSGYLSSFSGGVGPVQVSLTNNGTLELIAKANATVTGNAVASSRSQAVAAATAIVPLGINQAALGATAIVGLTNEGTIAIGASGAAHGLQTAFAHVDAEGLAQGAISLGNVAFLSLTPNGSGSYSGGMVFPGEASVSLANSGKLSVMAVANADADLIERADVHVTGAAQVARGLDASAIVDNAGTIIVAGSAKGAADGAVSNFVAAGGFEQIAFGPEEAITGVANSGSIDISARAIGTAATGKATDFAIAGGIDQDSLAIGTSTSSVTNSGKIAVAAVAKSNGGTGGFAGARARAINQSPLFGTVKSTLKNSGDLTDLAGASANAAGGAFASAHATGLFVDAANVVADVANSGHISVAASALAHGADGSAVAFAGGISMQAANHGTSAAAGSIEGSIVNSGQLSVAAKVDSKNGGTVAATATGIFLNATRNNATVVNSGKIIVDAVSAHDGTTNAYGVHVVDTTAAHAAAAGDLFTFTNDGGTLLARQSGDGGKTWKHGMALDLAGAPNSSVINLLGNGIIYGDIAVQDGDKIKVRAGTTYFDGVINSSFGPASGHTAASLDAGISGVGTLSIADGGNLILANARLTGEPKMYDGPAYAILDTLDVASDGTLTLQLQPTTGGVQTVGSYSQVLTDKAKLGGTLVAEVTTANGLFANNYSWQNVIDANVRSGTFTNCALGGRNAGSVLLTLTCSYDSNANVDLTLARNAFGSVAGLNRNAISVGSGLEKYYNVGLTGEAASMFKDLFSFTDAANYNTALNMLSGSVYANYLNSFPSLGVHANDLTDHATSCETSAVAGSLLECRASLPVHVWGQVDYQTRRAKGDSEAGSSQFKRVTGLLGIDTNVGNVGIAGIEAGNLTNSMSDHQFGDNAKGDGWIIGAYGVVDPGAFFVKGVATYSSLKGNATRHINFVDLAPGATLNATPLGDPDVKMWTLGLHGGARVSLSANSVLTPYLNYDLVEAKLTGFRESGGKAAGLTVGSSNAQHSFFTGGAKWAMQTGGLVAEANVGYRHRFGDQRSSVHEWFTAEKDADFDIVSASEAQGTMLAGVSVSGNVGPFDLRIGYEGQFNSRATSHSGNLKIALPLGGHKATAPVR